MPEVRAAAADLTTALRVWTSLAVVHVGLRRRPLPELAARLGRRHRVRSPRSPDQLSRAVDRFLRLRGRRPRCLVSSLVLVRLLRMQGDAPELVIGLPKDATRKDAHAWIELLGRDVGPPPGRGANVEIVRYG